MKAAANPWIRSPMADLGWIIACPLIGWATVSAVWEIGPWSDRMVYAMVAGFLVAGHHMPGWLRAWGEPALYDRYKARLWVSALAVPVLIVTPTLFGLGVLAIGVTACFDLWHVSMQQHGIGRIYGAKAGDRHRTSARTDLACVLTWYGTIVAWSDSWSWFVASSLRQAGLPVAALLTRESWRGAQIALLVASGALLAAYVRNAAQLRREAQVVAWRKHAVHVVAFTVMAVTYQDPSWYRSQCVQNIFHAMQFFFLVWVFGRNTMSRDPRRPRPFYRRLFGTPAGIVPYIVLILAYGVLFRAVAVGRSTLSLGGEDLALQLLGSIGMTSLLLHYYVDSFIWKVRSRTVRATLAIGEVAVEAPPDKEPALSGAWHAVRYFGLPILLVAVVGHAGRSGGASRSPDLIAHEAMLFPRSAAGAYELGRTALASGAPEAAAAALRRARELSPEFDGPAAALADLREGQGDWDAALRWSAVEVRTLPDNIAARFALANRLAKAERHADAEAAYREILRREPEAADAWFNLGMMADKQARPDEAADHFERARALRAAQIR